jgi:glycopeptide antibiotics resistance protein
MDAHNIITHSPQSDLDKLVAQWTPRIFNFSLLLILFSTLFPFDFSFQNGFSIKEIVESFSNTSDLSDQIGNILLFMPLGFGLSGLLPAKRLGVTAKFAIVLLISASLSSTVEVLQAFLPLRASTISDIVTNTLGGGLGFLCFHLWRNTIISYALTLMEKSKKALSSKKLTAGFIGYIVLVCLISVALPGTMNLKNWDTTFPLLLGNEKTGNRPWQGSISELYIVDRAISQQEIARAFSDKRSFAGIGDSLVGFYQLTEQGGYHDRSGHLPDLVWRGQPSKAQDESGVFLTSNHWLETATPVTSLSQRIQKTSQFTLNVTVSTAKTTQAGPARIVSLSSDTNHRNFTLGQDKSDLVFRLRTPISGENGTNPDIVVPGLFADTSFHHIIITYDGLFLNIYIDKSGNSRSFELAPMSYRVLYYELIFIPLGLLLALLFKVYKGRFIFYIFLISGGILVPSLIVEGILASGSGRSFSLANLLTSLSVTVATLLVFTLRSPYKLDKKSLSNTGQ